LSLNLIVWLLLCVIWGSTWIVIKLGLSDLPPISFAAMRFVLAVAILFFVLRIQKIPLPRKASEWRLIAITGLLQFSFTYGLIFWAEQYISSGLTAVLQATISVFGLLLALIWLPSERITPLKLIAVFLGIVGVAVIFGDQLRVQSTLAFIASVGVVISAYTASQSSILIKAKGAALHPAALLYGQMLCGLPPFIAYGLIVEGNPLNFHWTWAAVAAIFYLTIFGTVIAFWLFYWLLGKVESTMPMMISVVTPLIAVLLGWMILGETLPPQTFFGGLLIMASIAITIFKRKAS
jgi:drug/metabolite transporter (DMT)-like permease